MRLFAAVVGQTCSCSGRVPVAVTYLCAEASAVLLSDRYVVDSGFVKQLNHNPRVGLDVLEVVPISK